MFESLDNDIGDLFRDPNEANKDPWSCVSHDLGRLSRFARDAGDLCKIPHLIPQDVVQSINEILFIFNNAPAIKPLTLEQSTSKALEQLHFIENAESLIAERFKGEIEALKHRERFFKNLYSSTVGLLSFTSAESEIQKFIDTNSRMIGSRIKTSADFYNQMFRAREPSKWYEDVNGVGEGTAKDLIKFLSEKAKNSVDFFLLKSNFSTREANFIASEHKNTENVTEITLNVDGYILNICLKIKEYNFHGLKVDLFFSGSFLSKVGVGLNLEDGVSSDNSNNNDNGDNNNNEDDFFSSFELDL